MVARGGDVPLAHELFGEAWSQRFEHPRSALVIGIAAVEVAFTKYVGAVVPDAEWLVENLPAPPLDKMLKDYLPLLRARQTASAEKRPFPGSLFKSLKRGIELRNRIVHRGEKSPTVEMISVVLTAVADLLWMLDSYQDFAGALEFVSYDVRKQL